eukprot:scaffold137832_cov28-Tisochrysis_lutea.AAC.4
MTERRPSTSPGESQRSALRTSPSARTLGGRGGASAAGIAAACGEASSSAPARGAGSGIGCARARPHMWMSTRGERADGAYSSPGAK